MCWVWPVWGTVWHIPLNRCESLRCAARFEVRLGLARQLALGDKYSDSMPGTMTYGRKCAACIDQRNHDLCCLLVVFCNDLLALTLTLTLTLLLLCSPLLCSALLCSALVPHCVVWVALRWPVLGYVASHVITITITVTITITITVINVFITTMISIIMIIRCLPGVANGARMTTRSPSSSARPLIYWLICIYIYIYIYKSINK